MTVKTEYITTETKGNRDLVDLTPKLREIVKKCGLVNGIITAFAPGSTAGITTIEYEPGLTKDISIFLESLLPYAGNYHHHETWHDDNGSSHLQASFIGPSITVPVVDGDLTLGTWQQVVLIDCDTRPRRRRVVVQMLF
ncbi:MAG: secondary thiamine-phosphate synthase enzyme [Spirochaetes bacterium RBG_16_49_21]|nr:MAG: secondary thiamine-phosphate synthase enzyme [Spirochaetes bacterium RBG_16_49_21]